MQIDLWSIRGLKFAPATPKSPLPPSRHVGQAEVAAQIAEGHPQVVDAQQ